MTTFTRLLFSIFLISFFSYKVSAQNFSGIATYTTSSSIHISMDSTQVPLEEITRIQNELKKKMQKEYTLVFNTTESSWKQVESLNSGPAKASGNGMELMIVDNSSDEVLYKNLPMKQFERGSDLMGKKFIVKDSLRNYNWVLTNETKTIGNYKCQKAISTRIVEAKKFSTGMTEMEVTQDTIKTVVWFTPDIPVAHGPQEYTGLPGLILEVNTGNRVVICTKVILNPTEPVKIERPTKGKVVTSEEYRAISEKKMEEMMKRYNGGDGENIIEIRTSG
ncbi:GLPGLI family protein [Fulvivirga ligni]|uniref:GLPGLI family protein n=1 Tax=Fulvivirga ligni TaxID=2904246 RepID=UPI001F297B50|nr:GLPGLI family protein [Fulvivirga ligni]UII22710.1 GLPGLI family protein [Fulvivirga ligni]